jgi:hypothetical protein
VNGMGNKKTINNPQSRVRQRIIQYALTVEKFNLHQLHDWYFDHYPRDCIPKNKLSGVLRVINCLEKLGYKTYKRQTNMEYKLRDEYVVD